MLARHQTIKTMGEEAKNLDFSAENNQIDASVGRRLSRALLRDPPLISTGLGA